MLSRQDHRRATETNGARRIVDAYAGRAGDTVQHRLLEKQVSKLEQVNAGIRNVERAIERGAALS
ncbi:hypothetical protein [Botrimarina sp.]|uniref:hypothetical protein n=1 Tax=Botrimarina sp. TaxID=2795802 RepID=UPI0032EE54CE